jgi:hypothetical protein
MARGMNECAHDALRKAVGSALEVLLAGMPESRMEESRREVSAVVGRLYQRGGVRLPEWQCEAWSAISGRQGSPRHDRPAGNGPHME